MKTLSQLDEIYPYSVYGKTNARKIVQEAMDRFNKCPCGYHKDECESYGLTVDWMSEDWGTELTGREEAYQVT